MRIPSIVRLHKLATLEKKLVQQSLGTLTASDFQQMQTKLQVLIQSIHSTAWYFQPAILEQRSHIQAKVTAIAHPHNNLRS
ncbi:hypothetical protein LBWT_54100 [Leptolyngbya boryana IAM M-101]|nr:hypothetical protein LBWT_54100 [Leptolyngbya boryana IAM M-101]BAS65787.1 hypothetical protein LBDG_54100 [Leptolyngbya boryana dg5]